MPNLQKSRNGVSHALVALALSTILLPTAGAQFVQQGTKLVGTGVVGTASEGYSVAISSDGNTAIVGGNSDNPRSSDPFDWVGAAWVFTRTNGVWSQQGSKLVGTDAVGATWQGTSVAISADGNTAMVGGDNDNGLVGAAWMYMRINGVWSQQGAKLVGTGGGDGFQKQGLAVALSADGNTAIVGGPGDNNNAGATWVFTRANGVWSQQGSKLVGTGAVGVASQGNGGGPWGSPLCRALHGRKHGHHRRAW